MSNTTERKSVLVELSKPLRYTGESGEVEASFITLLEPTGKVSHICCEIEALIQSSLVKMSDLVDADTLEKAKDAKEKNEASSEMDADSALIMMNAAGVDMQKMVLHFRDLFKEVALMGGEKAITIPRMNDLTHSDFRKLIGTYVGNFIML